MHRGAAGHSDRLLMEGNPLESIMCDVGGMGKAEFYAVAAQELRAAGCGRVFEELRGELHGSKGIRPADAVALWDNRVVVVEMKSPREMRMLPLGTQGGLIHDYLAPVRNDLAERVKAGEISRATARHLLYLSQAEHYAHTFAAGHWGVSAADEIAWADAGLQVGYCVPIEEEVHLSAALEHRPGSPPTLLRGLTTVTAIYSYVPEWKPRGQLPLFSIRTRGSE